MRHAEPVCVEWAKGGWHQQVIRRGDHYECTHCGAPLEAEGKEKP